MIIENQDRRYEVGDQVAQASNYRLYLCRQEGVERQCLLQIAVDAAHNGALDRAAYILAELKRRADELEEEYVKVKTDPKMMLNYDLGFPELLDSFVCQEQGGRRINILAFRSVDDVSKMVPIGNIIHRDGKRVDLRTSAWITGKSLKLFVLAHSMGISIRPDNTNILIEPDEHYVVFFDWSDSTFYSTEIPSETRSEAIAKMAQVVITLVGGDYETRSFPDDEGGMEEYKTILLALADGVYHNAEKAHARFYEIVDALWERAYYPFTACNL